MLIAAQVAFIGTNLDQIEAVALLVGNGVGADQFKLGYSTEERPAEAADAGDVSAAASRAPCCLLLHGRTL